MTKTNPPAAARLAATRWYRRVALFFAEYDHDAVEVASGMAALCAWGAWLLYPGWTTFANPAFAAMAAVAPEVAWGALFTACGALQLAAWLLDRPVARQRLALWMAVLWAFVAAMLVVSTPYVTGVLIYAQLAGGNLWVFLRLARRRLSP